MKLKIITITPNLSYYSSSEYEESNHILRKYKYFLPYIVRIQFTDEDKGKAHFAGMGSEPFLDKV